MTEWRYFIVGRTWALRVSADGARAEYVTPDGRWAPTTGDAWPIATRGRQVAGEEAALREARAPFAIVPAVGIGPFRLGMTEGEVEDLCREYGLRNASAFTSGLAIGFHDGRATSIELAADMGLSLAGEPLLDASDQNVRRLLVTIAPPGPDWTELDGLVVTHWEFGDDFVFSFRVYAPGYRF